LACHIVRDSPAIHDDHPRRAKLAREQLRVFQRTAAERNIGPLFEQVDHLVGQGYLKESFG